MKNTKLTADSLSLLLTLIRDSGNWSNSPLVDLSAAEKGNLTHLKKAGLVRTSRSDGCDFITFLFASGDVVTDGARTFSLVAGESHSIANEVLA